MKNSKIINALFKLIFNKTKSDIITTHSFVFINNSIRKYDYDYKYRKYKCKNCDIMVIFCFIKNKKWGFHRAGYHKNTPKNFKNLTCKQVLMKKACE